MSMYRDASLAADSRLSAMGIGENPDAQKQPMGAVHYRPADGIESCSTCVHFDGENTCDVVAGRIRPDGVSDLYEPAERENEPTDGLMPA